MVKKLPAIAATLALILLCAAALAYGIYLLAAGGEDGLRDLLSKPERMLYPYDLDERPAVTAGSAEELLPHRVGSFVLAYQPALGQFVTELGLAGAAREAIEARYNSGSVGATVIIVHCDSADDVKERLAGLRDRLDAADGLRTTRVELVGAHPFVKYRYGGWESAEHGLAWGNGEWLFFVYAGDPDALDAVAGEFPH